MPNKGRRILIAVTALEGGIVVVQPPNGAPQVLTGDAAALLHELASDATQPEMKTEAVGSSRLMSLAERLLLTAMGGDDTPPAVEG